MTSQMNPAQQRTGFQVLAAFGQRWIPAESPGPLKLFLALPFLPSRNCSLLRAWNWEPWKLFPSLETAGGDTEREREKTLLNGPQSTLWKGASNTQVIEQLLKPSLHPSCKLTFSKPQTSGSITFKSQHPISNLHVLLDNKELLFRKSLVLLWNSSSFTLFPEASSLSWQVVTELNSISKWFELPIACKYLHLKIRYSK